MVEQKCLGVPCDGRNCIRASYIRTLGGNGDSIMSKEVLKHLINLQRRVISEGKCAQEEDLEAAVKNLESSIPAAPKTTP